MIWTLKIECMGGIYFKESCVRVIEIDSGASLCDLHEAIQDAVDFDRDHLFEFFAGRNMRNQKVTFGDQYESEDLWDTFSEYILEKIYPLPQGCKLYYHFDFGDDWYFEIKKVRKKPFEPEPGVKYPRVIEKIGPNLEQYPEYSEDY